MTMFWTWVWLRTWGPSMSFWGNAPWINDLSFRFDHIACAISLAFIMLVSRLPRSRRFMAPLLKLGASVCAGLGVGIAIFFAIGQAEVPASSLSALGMLSGLLSGCSRSFLLCLWGASLLSLDIRSALLVHFGSVVVSAALYYLCWVGPTGLEFCISLACALAGPFAAPSKTLEAAGLTPHEGARPKVSPRLTTGGNTGTFLLLTALVFGVADGFVAGLYEALPHMDQHFFSYGRIPATAAAALLSYCAIRLSQQRLTGRALQIGIPIIALAFLILPYEAQPTLGRFLGILGYQFLLAVFWIVLSPYPPGNKHRVPSASPALLALLCGTPLGILLWDLAGGADTVWNMQTVSIIAMFALILLMVFSTSSVVSKEDKAVARKSPSHASVNPPNPQRPPQDHEASIVPHAVDAAQVCAQRFNLTSRELEVCRLLGRGRNRQYIAESLGVSLQTARTHVTNVYRKAGVHTQQEFLDLYEALGSSESHLDDGAVSPSQGETP